MSDKSKIGSAIKTGLKNFFTKNIFLKIISLVFATLLWGYVLMSQNPARTKTIYDVPVNIEGEADLIARNLVLSGDKELESITVKVRTELAQYADLDVDDITATISLAGITKKGEYNLGITATSSIGTPESVSPRYVTVVADDLVTRRIPIEIDTVGALPEGYWHGELTSSRAELDISGASEQVADIVKARAELDISGYTTSVNTSVLLTLYDSEGNVISDEVLHGTLPSVTVRMEVLPTKQVPIDIESALLGADSLPANYEVVSNGINGSRTVNIVGGAEVLAGIDSLTIDPVDISGRTESLLMEAPLIVPDGVRLIDGDTVSLYVNIREKTSSATFVEVPIEVQGLGRKLTATLSQDRADVLITGRVSLISLIERSDVTLYIDVADMEAGRYDLPVNIKLPDEEMMVDLSWTLSSESVTVTIE